LSTHVVVIVVIIIIFGIITMSAVMQWQVVHLSISDVEVRWSHRSEYFENNVTAD